MISIAKKFLFIHVPKTGGNSIQNILRDYSDDDIVCLAEYQDGVERFEVRNKDYDVTKHSTLAHYKSILDPNLYNSLFKFATIRNPWDLMVSFYFSPHRGIQEWDRDNFLNLLHSVSTLRYYICDGPDRNGFGPLDYEEQIDADIDFLIRFECIENDFKGVCEKLQIPFSCLPKRNISKRTHYSEYYDEELIEMVRDKFEEEIKLGNYVFEYA